LNYGRNTRAEKKKLRNLGVDRGFIVDPWRNSSLCDVKESGRAEQNVQSTRQNVFSSASTETSIQLQQKPALTDVIS
jgi:hypothetical protein